MSSVINYTDSQIKNLETQTAFLADKINECATYLLREVENNCDSLEAQSELNKSILKTIRMQQETITAMSRTIATWKLFSFAMSIISLTALGCCIFYQ